MEVVDIFPSFCFVCLFVCSFLCCCFFLCVYVYVCVCVRVFLCVMVVLRKSCFFFLSFFCNIFFNTGAAASKSCSVLLVRTQLSN